MNARTASSVSALEIVYKHESIDRLKRLKTLIKDLRLQNARLQSELMQVRMHLRALEPYALYLSWDEEF